MASGTLNFLEAVSSPEVEPVLSAGLALGLVAALFKVGLGQLKAAENPLVPDEGLSIRNMCELIAEFILKLGDSTMGKHNRKYLPFVATLFIYLFVMNAMGLVPGFNGPTDGLPGGVMFNLGIALVVFAMYNYWGVKEVGAGPYMKHLCGPVWWLAPLLFMIEILSHALRPVVLSIRLGGNMMADHLVLGIFTDLTKVLIPVVFYFLGLFVCFMQAFIFTILTMVYISLAVAHEEEH